MGVLCATAENSGFLKNIKLENVSIANALQLEAARRRAVPIRFNFVARAKFEVAQPICCRLTAFFTAYTLRYAVTLTFDLDLDLMTLSMYHVLPLRCGIVCTKFKLS